MEKTLLINQQGKEFLGAPKGGKNSSGWIRPHVLFPLMMATLQQKSLPTVWQYKCYPPILMVAGFAIMCEL